MPNVAEGDCIVSIADRLGFRDYHAVWDDGANAELKRNRPNPNALVQGDDVKAPDAKVKVEKKAVDATWTFVLKKKKPVKVRIVLFDRDNQPVKDKEWRIAGSQAAKGKTKADGLVELEGIPPQDTAATLTVKWVKKTSPASPPKKPSKRPPAAYPPTIVPSDFLDEAPDEREDAEIEWTLKVGSLPSFNVKTGTLARLGNLGFNVDVDSADPFVARAVIAYQRFHKNEKNGTGLVADVEVHVRDRHDNP